MLRRTALALAVVSALPPASAHATPPAPAPPDGYTRAQQRLEAGDLVGAAEIWEGLLDGIPESEETRARREAMLINALDARLEAYRRQVDAEGRRDPAHLVTAQITLRRYLRAHVAAYGQQRALSAPVQERAATLAMALAESDPPRSDPPPPESAVPAPAMPTPPDAAPAPARDGSGLLVGGIGLGVLGLSVGLTMIPLGAALGRNAENIYTVAVINASNTSASPQRALYLSDAAEAERAGRTANRVAIAGGIVSPLLLGGAAAMIVLGLQRRRASVQHGPRVSSDYAGWEARVTF